MNNRQTISHADLLSNYLYTKASGIFVSTRTGMRVGFVKNDRGNRVIEIRGKRYPETRLAVFYETGKWPAGQVKHIDKTKRVTKFKDLVFYIPDTDFKTDIRPEHQTFIQRLMRWING